MEVQKAQRIKASCSSTSGKTTKSQEVLGRGQWMVTLQYNCNVRIDVLGRTSDEQDESENCGNNDSG